MYYNQQNEVKTECTKLEESVFLSRHEDERRKFYSKQRKYNRAINDQIQLCPQKSLDKVLKRQKHSTKASSNLKILLSKTFNQNTHRISPIFDMGMELMDI